MGILPTQQKKKKQSCPMFSVGLAIVGIPQTDHWINSPSNGGSNLKSQSDVVWGLLMTRIVRLCYGFFFPFFPSFLSLSLSFSLFSGNLFPPCKGRTKLKIIFPRTLWGMFTPPRRQIRPPSAWQIMNELIPYE